MRNEKWYSLNRELTGYNDSKGTNIYGGDIIKRKDSTAVVVWDKKDNQWTLLGIVGNFLGHTSLRMSRVSGWEVIGTSENNPEMLQAPKSEQIKDMRNLLGIIGL